MEEWLINYKEFINLLFGSGLLVAGLTGVFALLRIAFRWWTGRPNISIVAPHKKHKLHRWIPGSNAKEGDLLLLFLKVENKSWKPFQIRDMRIRVHSSATDEWIDAELIESRTVKFQGIYTIGDKAEEIELEHPGAKLIWDYTDLMLPPERISSIILPLKCPHLPIKIPEEKLPEEERKLSPFERKDWIMGEEVEVTFIERRMKSFNVRFHIKL